jgi:protein TonB
MAQGQARRYAGGVTTADGTSRVAVRVAVPGGTGEGPSAGPSPARSVRLPSSRWRCPWPRAADALSIDEQLVVVRARVREDGSVASTEVLTDPGHGFGAAAIACLERQRLEPAIDARGHAMASTSPPIRVRFTR